MLACLNDIDIQSFMQVMRDGAIDGFDIRAGEQIAVILRGNLDRWNVLLKPAEHSRVGIADAHDTRNGLLIKQVAPACDGTGKLAPHQATADNTKLHFAFLHGFTLLSVYG